ncbi:hypothetical protein [Marinilactibacillus psychrotolerans]|uniref:hypothetical protein n=1 Tax=Marinilactibacillus psychrotolerans TaxID=191770 RepID=UPI001867CFB9|nr:hypothetical protein [Marinilactibacillus psychrotolerans]
MWQNIDNSRENKNKSQDFCSLAKNKLIYLVKSTKKRGYAMIGMIEDYRLNLRAILRSDLCEERKQAILSRLIEQITVLYENSPYSLSQNVEDVTEEERAALCEVRKEATEEIQKLTRQS